MRLKFSDNDLQAWWNSSTAAERFDTLLRLSEAGLITQDQLRALLKVEVKDNTP